MDDPFRLFLILFHTLKHKVNNSPKNLDWLPKKTPELRTLCFQLDEEYISLRRILSNHPNKASIVPSIFKEQLDEFEEQYRKKVQNISEPERQKADEMFFSDLEKAAKEKEKQGQGSEEFYSEILNSMPSSIGSDFNPIVDNAALLIIDLFEIVSDIVEFGDLQETFSDKHIGAINYFQDVVGIDFPEIAKRWETSPHLFISESLNLDIQKLVEMYNEAVKCYIFGLNVASLAMCRALLEYILIKYYRIDSKDNRGLKNIIRAARKQYISLKSLSLTEIKNAGDTAMHTYDKGLKIDNYSVEKHLNTLRYLVQSIPK
jgi:hypothetical protein